MSGPTSPTSQGGGDMPTMSEAQQLAQALIVAAQNAASASAAHTTLSQQLMTQLSAQSTGDAPAAGSPSRTAKFAHASKMVRMPDPFTAVGAEAEQTAWPDFELNLLAWLGAADTEFETDLQWISDHVDTEFDMDVHSDDMATRSKELHSILVGLLRNRSLKVLRGVSGRNGYEVYRQLLKLFKPSTKPRAMALLSALMGLPTFGKDKSLYDHIQGLDRLMSEYQKASGLSVPDEVSLSVLVRCLPAHIRQHIQLSLDQSSTYATVRSRVLGFETVTNNWAPSRIHSEFGIIGTSASSAQDTGGFAPMDISRVETKGKQKGKSKSKGKSKMDASSHKGKGKAKSKFSDIGKGKGKPSTQVDKSNVCLYCGKAGHWKRDCRKYKHDQATGQVRQVEGGISQQAPPPPPVNQGFSQPQQSGAQQPLQPHVSFVQPSPHTTFVQQPQQNVGNVRRFEFAPDWPGRPVDEMREEPWIDDLTSDSILGGNIYSLSAVSTCLDALPCSCTTFDMTYSDCDGVWTVDTSDVNHVRAVEIILDSGADGSALPMEDAHTGVATASDDRLRFVDAQGSPLNISSTRLATVDFGDFSLKEEFIVASITSPLLSLGKLMKHGWNLQKVDNSLHLVKADKAIPVAFKRNSLCISGNIRMVEDSGSVHLRALQLRDSLQRVRTTWTKLGAECYGIKTYKPTCVDVSLAPAASMLWYRTTLVKRSGRWQLHEHNRFVTDEYAASSLTAALPNPGSVQEVITIGHTKECTHEQLGFSVIEEALDLLGPVGGSSSSSAAPQPFVDAPALEQFDAPALEQADESMNPPLQVMPPVDVPDPFEAPVAADEPDPPDEVLAGADEIVLDGTRIDSTSSLAVLRAACSALGISVNGSRAQLFKRLVQHLQQQELLAAHSVKHNLGKELQRPANQPGIPAQPTEEEEVREHNATHIPFKAWCELCVAHKGRQDKHHREGHVQSEHSLVSFDFGYVDRGTDDPLTVLFIHDRSTKMMHAVPTAAKGGKSLPYLTQELCRFVTWLGHQAVCFRTDNEPSTISLLDACRKALKGLGVHTTVELVVPGNKEANGGAEITVQTLRNQANLLIEQVERAVGADGKVLFSALHPLYSWAIIHAGWLHCRFAVSNGETAYERCTGKEYHGKVCYCGETCMGYLKPTAKGLPSWQRGVWLGKTQNNDAHIISCNGGLFMTRSVRRIPSPWILSEVGNVEMSPWECSFATLGSRLMVPKRVLKPTAQVAPALPPASVQPEASKLKPVLDVEAEAVRGLPPTPMEPAVEELPAAAIPAQAQAGFVPQPGIMAPPPASAAPSGLATPMQDDQQAPLTPVPEDEPASKKARICVVAGVEYEHEDDHNYTSFTSDELDSLEEFDFGLTNDDGDEPASEDVLVQQLIFP